LPTVFLFLPTASYRMSRVLMLIVGGGAVVAISFVLTLSVIDNGFAATLAVAAHCIDP
jgi:hypothetical protein